MMYTVKGIVWNTMMNDLKCLHFPIAAELHDQERARNNRAIANRRVTAGFPEADYIVRFSS
jgi:hypothetical protein